MTLAMIAGLNPNIGFQRQQRRWKNKTLRWAILRKDRPDAQIFFPFKQIEVRSHELSLLLLMCDHIQQTNNITGFIVVQQLLASIFQSRSVILASSRSNLDFDAGFTRRCFSSCSCWSAAWSCASMKLHALRSWAICAKWALMRDDNV
jgi:hypothetical protein